MLVPPVVLLVGRSSSSYFVSSSYVAGICLLRAGPRTALRRERRAPRPKPRGRFVLFVAVFLSAFLASAVGVSVAETGLPWGDGGKLSGGILQVFVDKQSDRGLVVGDSPGSGAHCLNPLKPPASWS